MANFHAQIQLQRPICHPRPTPGNALPLESATQEEHVLAAPKGSGDVAVGDSPPIHCPQQSISRESGAGCGRSQEEYHRRPRFQDELRALLEKHRIEYEGRYLED